MVVTGSLLALWQVLLSYHLRRQVVYARKALSCKLASVVHLQLWSLDPCRIGIDWQWPYHHNVSERVFSDDSIFKPQPVPWNLAPVCILNLYWSQSLSCSVECKLWSSRHRPWIIFDSLYDLLQINRYLKVGKVARQFTNKPVHFSKIQLQLQAWVILVSGHKNAAKRQYRVQ